MSDKELIARGAEPVTGDLILNREVVGQYRNGQFILTPAGVAELARDAAAPTAKTTKAAKPTAAPATKTAKASKPAAEPAEAPAPAEASAPATADPDIFAGLNLDE